MNFDDYYNIIFDLKSLSKLKEGFPIIYSKTLKDKYDELKEKDGVMITAIGNSNKGKTYILSKIFETELPFNHSTKGISIKYVNNTFKKDSNKKYVILDTEGSEKSIKISNEDKNEINKLNKNEKFKKIQNNINDRKLTESFIQHFALDSADIVIVVVGLTFQDQKLLNRIKKYCNGKKNLFVIHNLMYIDTKEEVEYYNMNDVIEKSLLFNLEKRNMVTLNKDKEFMNEYFYVEENNINEKKDKTNYVIHLIMGREGSQAGSYYNQSTIQFIRESISAVEQPKKFDVINRFSEYLCLYGNEFFDLPQLDILEEKESNFQLIAKQNIEIDDNNIFKINVPYDLIVKIIDNDHIFENIYKSNIPSLPYSYYKKDDKFIIQIEYCGKLKKFDIKKNILNRQYRFNIIVKTEKNSKNLNSNINRGEFITSFIVSVDFMIIKSDEFKIENDEKYGILKIIYEINAPKLDNEDEDLGDL